MMDQLYHERRQQHMHSMAKYLKYVFNDHFMIVLFFLFGGAFLYYASLIKTLQPPLPMLNIIAIMILWFFLFQGKVPTLFKEADQLFLLPKETHLPSYLASARRYGMILPACWLAGIIGILMPLLVLNQHIAFHDYIIIVIMMWILKYTELYIQTMMLYDNDTNTWLRYSNYIISLVIISMALYGLLWAAMIIDILLFIVIYMMYRRYSAYVFKWQYAVTQEEQRMIIIYRFINLFTDVPEVKVAIHRRKYLDWLLKWIPFQASETYLYLYMRHILRSNEYSGLILRLNIIASFFLYFNDNYYISLCLAALFLYLILFQLLPLYQQFDFVLATKLYPVSNEQKINAMKKIMMMVTLVSAIVMGGVTVFSLSMMQSISILLLLTIEGYSYNTFILQRKLKRYINY